MLGRKEFVKLWVNALRSGNYAQGTRKLRNWNSEYCCLGVACEELVKLNLLEVNSFDEFGNSDNWSSLVLPENVSEMFQIDAGGVFNVDKLSDETVRALSHEDEEFNNVLIKYSDLISVNDSGHYDFDFIADLIEEIEEKDAWVKP